MLFALGAGRYPPATQPYRDFTLSRIEVTRAFLRPTDPGQRRASNEPKVPARAERVHDSPPTFARYLYTEVGRDHPSTDRADWIYERWRERRTEDGVTLCILYVAGAPAGFCELRAAAGPSPEIAPSCRRDLASFREETDVRGKV